MKRLLFAWVGTADFKGAENEAEHGRGPIAAALLADTADEAHLLWNYLNRDWGPYQGWLSRTVSIPVRFHRCPLEDPTDYASIYRSARDVVEECLKEAGTGAQAVFHLSPGTPAMAAVWIVLGQTRFGATLIDASRERGVRTVRLPFEIFAEVIPALLRPPRDEIERLTAGLPDEAPEFAQIVYRSDAMRRVIALARRAAPLDVPVLIEGETGTGKELLARAIHQASLRKSGEFLAVNCGAIPSSLVESTLFGHEKGAFTGAVRRRKGHFEEADGGTLFLDEIGELSPSVQVQLLRVLQEGEIQRVGGSAALKVDVRVVAATNRNLMEEMASGRFRSDLLYRVAVATLKLPPLREREGDLGLLVDHFLARANERVLGTGQGVEHRKLTREAKKALLQHSWPGNVRELENTLTRAVIWSTDPSVSASDIRQALLPASGKAGRPLLDRPLGEGFSLEGVLAEVVRHYIPLALDRTGGNKTRAAGLLGFRSYQTLTNWMERYGLVPKQSS